ncbi:MAG TPA: biotin synthase BioB [Chitinophagales bacterium]|jgi:biotin synthase|nr:biotin synthase BioB [Chitinophagales bacterium]HQW80159.1 biotin synthase BioB [Chitinophagales bacterium]HRB67961.1 biotin synthase BioB [Chitinophagales bacterium]
MNLHTNWTFQEILNVYNKPLLDLVYEAATVHRQNNDPNEIQVCTLLSVKTGGCTEDCSYCPQAARYNTGLKAHKLMDVNEVLEKALEAKQTGSTRFCMGAAWREIRDNRDFDRVLDMVKGVNEIGLEVCCTMGMLTEEQAQKLKSAGLSAYNHNVDTSEDYYDKIITTRTYDDRLKTIGHVRKAGISVCSGGIIGLGESVDARIGLVHTLASLPQAPDSVPINALVPVEGTPMEGLKRVSAFEMVRMIATVRIVLPNTQVRLSAGRLDMTVAEQALCFMAGANSIFAGDKLLTTPNPNFTDDMEMLNLLGLKPMESFKENEIETASV